MNLRKTSRGFRHGVIGLGTLALLGLTATCGAQNASSYRGPTHHPTITSFSVETPDETLTYPDYLIDLPDEHMTFIPFFDWLRPWEEQQPTYLVFDSSRIVKGGNAGAIVLETTDLVTFTAATDKGYAEQVMSAPVFFTACNPSFDTEFDENYAGPGSVVQDPTRPPGNLIMIYEAENHCPGGVNNPSYYATVGFARSSDGGKTWPAAANGPMGNAARHPILKGPIPEPATAGSPAMGDAIPSAFVDGGYIYVAYVYHAQGLFGDLIRVARARLHDSVREYDNDDHHGSSATPYGQLQFYKWNNGAFSQPGIGGEDSAVVPATGCLGTQMMPSISYNDELGLYMMIFVCNSFPVNGLAAWYYSTATSLELQDWSVPQPILNSKQTVTQPCNLAANPPNGAGFDGFYPSFMSPGAAPGHLRLTGRAFLLSGCDTGSQRAFASRKFKITVER